MPKSTQSRRVLREVLKHACIGAALSIALAVIMPLVIPSSWSYATRSFGPWPVAVPRDWPKEPYKLDRTLTFGCERIEAGGPSEIWEGVPPPGVDNSVTIDRAGWPFRVLESRVHQVRPAWTASAAPTPPPDEHDRINLPLSRLPWRDRWATWISTGVLWHGLIADTALFGGASFVIAGSVARSRRDQRVWRGGCAECGYPLQKMEPGQPCPECGTPKNAGMKAGAWNPIFRPVLRLLACSLVGVLGTVLAGWIPLLAWGLIGGLKPFELSRVPMQLREEIEPEWCLDQSGADWRMPPFWHLREDGSPPIGMLIETASSDSSVSTPYEGLTYLRQSTYTQTNVGWPMKSLCGWYAETEAWTDSGGPVRHSHRKVVRGFLNLGLLNPPSSLPGVHMWPIWPVYPGFYVHAVGLTILAWGAAQTLETWRARRRQEPRGG